MENILFYPPAAFILVLFVSWGISFFSSALEFKHQGKTGALNTAYSCGEEVETSRVQPDYGQFFPFAFFFTILHVVALMLATVPSGGWGPFVMAAIYLVGAIFGLLVLFRR